MQVVRPDVARDQVHVVVQCPRPVLDLEQAVADVRVRVRAPVDDLGAVHREAARVLRVRALVGHQEPEPADVGVGDRVERVEVAAVQLDPFVPDVVRCHRVLHRQQRHDLVVLEDDVALGAQDEPDVEEAPGELRMARLGLGHHERVPLPGQTAEIIGLRAGDVNRAFGGELLVIEVEHLVVEPLQRSLGHGDQPDRQVQAGQPRRGLDQVREMLEVRLDLVTAADAAHRRNQAEGLIRLDHGVSLRPAEPGRVRPIPGCHLVYPGTTRSVWLSQSRPASGLRPSQGRAAKSRA